MSLLKLKLIVLIDRYKQVTAVANALQIKQPTVSFHMKKMEEEWGVKLFETRTGKVLLTPHGKMLLHYASQIDDLYKEATAKLALIGETEKKRLVLGCTASTAEWLVQAGALSKLENIHAQIKLTVIVHEQEELFQRLNSGMVDIAVCGENPRHTEIAEWRHQHVRSSELALVAPEGQLALLQGKAATRQLHDFDFAQLADSSVEACIHSWSKKEHHFLQPSSSFGSVALLLQAVAASGSLAILPQNIIPRHNGLTTLELEGSPPVWNIYASWRHSYWDQALAGQVADELSRI
jgi:DNA-binding transcriptional LysR family regulator